MNKKAILSLGAIALLTTSIYAQCNQDRDFNPRDQHDKKPHHMLNHEKGEVFFKVLREIDLTKKQYIQLDSIRQVVKKDTITISSAFTSSSFDKDKFIKLINDTRKQKLNKRAMVIEKVYAILTPKQKKDLKTLLDADKIRHNSMIRHRGARSVIQETLPSLDRLDQDLLESIHDKLKAEHSNEYHGTVADKSQTPDPDKRPHHMINHEKDLKTLPDPDKRPHMINHEKDLKTLPDPDKRPHMINHEKGLKTLPDPDKRPHMINHEKDLKTLPDPDKKPHHMVNHEKDLKTLPDPDKKPHHMVNHEKDLKTLPDPDKI